MVSLQLVPVHQSGGGMSQEGAQSYTATVISAAKVCATILSYSANAVSSFWLYDLCALLMEKLVGKFLEDFF